MIDQFPEQTGFDGKTTEYRYGQTNDILGEVVDGGVTTKLDFDLMGRLRKRLVTPAGASGPETFGDYSGGKLGDARTLAVDRQRKEGMDEGKRTVSYIIPTIRGAREKMMTFTVAA